MQNCNAMYEMQLFLLKCMAVGCLSISFWMVALVRIRKSKSKPNSHIRRLILDKLESSLLSSAQIGRHCLRPIKMEPRCNAQMSKLKSSPGKCFNIPHSSLGRPKWSHQKMVAGDMFTKLKSRLVTDEKSWVHIDWTAWLKRCPWLLFVLYSAGVTNQPSRSHQPSSPGCSSPLKGDTAPPAPLVLSGSPKK